MEGEREPLSRDEKDLISACETGDTEAVEDYLCDEDLNINCQDEDQGRATPFFIACREGQFDVVQLMVDDKRVKVNKANKFGWTPLRIACQKGHTKIVELLLKEEKVKVNKVDELGYTPLYAACWEGKTDVVKLLLKDSRVDVKKAEKNGITPFWIACQDQHLEIVELLLKDGRSDVEKEDKDKRSPFWIACSKGHTEAAEKLLRIPGVDINRANNDGWSPFYAACEKGHLKVVKLLSMEKDIEVNKPDKNGRTPFYFACEKGRTEIVKLLLADERIDINEAETIYKTTPFYIACEKGHNEIVKLLFHHKRIEVHETENKYGITPFYIACQEGHINIVKLLLESGMVNKNKAEKNTESTPFWIACFKGHLEVVKLLLKDDEVDINKPMNLGETPFYVACEKGQTEVVDLLLKDERVEVNKTDKKYKTTPLYIACRNGQSKVVKLLLKNSRVDLNKAENADGWTPLHVACEKGHTKIVKALLNDPRVEVNQTNKDGATPFYFACEKGNIEVIKLLLDCEKLQVIQAYANKFNQEDQKNGWTPFYVACYNNHTDVVKLLLKDERIRRFLTEEKILTQNISAATFELASDEDLLLKQTLNPKSVRKEKTKEKKVRVKKQNQKSRIKSVLELARDKNYTEIVELLEEIELKESNNLKFPSLWRAATRNDRKEVENLLAKFDFSYDLCSVQVDGNSLLVNTISSHFYEVTKVLLDHPKLDLKKALNQIDKFGVPLIKIAISINSEKIVRLLLEYPELDINAKDENGKTALHEAVYQGNINLASLILSQIKERANKEKEKDKEKKEKRASRNNQLRARISMRNTYSMDTLTREKKKKELMDEKDDKNMTDNDGLSVLHYAVMSDGIERAENVVAALLKDEEIYPNELDNFGETPFQLAIRLGRDRVVETLLKFLTVKRKENPDVLTHAVIHAPKVVLKLFDDCHEVKKDQSSNEKHYVNFKATGLGNGKKTVESVLQAMIKHKRLELIQHPLTTALMDCKWERYQKFFFLNLFLYSLFFVCLVSFLAMVRFPELYPGNDIALRVIIGVLSFLRLGIEGIQFVNLKLAYFLDASNYAELFIFISSLVLVFSMHINPLIWQIELGAMTVFISAINLVVFLRNLTYFQFGLYVVMLIEVAGTLVLVLPLLFLLMLAFTLGCYFAFDDSFGILLNSFIQFLFGDQELYDTIWTRTSLITPRILSLFFFVLMSLLLLNFLVGLAVGDIDGIKETAEVTSFSIRANTIYLFDRIQKLRKELPNKYPEDKSKEQDTEKLLESKPQEEESLETVVQRLEKSMVGMDGKMQQQQESFMKEMTEMRKELTVILNKIK